MARSKATLRKKGNHSADTMLKAMTLHRQRMSIQKAAKECKLAYPTLRRYIAKNININTEELQNIRLISNYDVNKIFTTEQEEALKAYIKKCALTFYGLATKDCRRVAYQMATVKNIKVPDNWKREKNGKI
jgi:hypothetical protein